jgi:hypothetical protein
MTEIFAGQCQCGNVRYHVTGESATLFACHCTECQRQSSSAFGMSLWIRDPELKLVTGTVQEWIRKLPSGRLMSCQFCPNCGTRLFHLTLGQSKILSVKPGTLFDTTQLDPVGHIWVDSKQKWFDLPSQALRYSQNPDSFEDLMDAWSEHHQ